MIGRLAALILLSSLILTLTAEVPQKISLTVIEAGGNVAFKCPVSEKEGKFFHWYKQPLGYMVQTVATGSYTKQTLTAQFKNQRFQVTEGGAHQILSIRNVSKDDEATYFCQNGTAYSQNFVNGIFLAVKDFNHEKSIIVEQTPETSSVQEGHAAIFKCSLPLSNSENRLQCPGEDSVYWFRAGSGESHPGFIYTHNNRSFTQGARSCVYSLSKTIQNSSDAGTYYCAVVTCGEILLGGGTTVETRSELYPVVIVLVVLLACCAILNVVLLCHAKRSRACEHCKGGKRSTSHYLGHDESTVEHSTNLDGDTEAENYAALNFSARKVRSGKEKKVSPQECVYSAVRADYQPSSPISIAGAVPNYGN
ncbi:uncharacterized protein LOC117816975 [Notolabrus celidotus]|uniref:uncharacterized protein LOC117816975 n=1 Tax=Notolabrus celidotus TaxID=1203425 RepID=UPI00148FB861|nr:uncharacterized protein LOC117816975 [Notolabrus celidotus]